jgi:hypothetical protein
MFEPGKKFLHLSKRRVCTGKLEESPERNWFICRRKTFYGYIARLPVARRGEDGIPFFGDEKKLVG